MVINGLKGGEREENHCSANPHSRELECQTGADRVHEKPFEGVVIERAVGVGDVETVMADMKRTYSSHRLC